MDFFNNFINYALNFVDKLGYIGLFITTYLEYACLPMPGEIILPFTGALIEAGKLTFLGCLISSTLGSILGALTSYYIGYLGGSVLIKKLQDKLPQTKESISLIDKLLNKYQKFAIFITRVAPLTRTYISLVAGSLKLNLKNFLLFSSAGILIWNIVLLFGGYFLGEDRALINVVIKKYSSIMFFLIAILIIIFIVKKYILSKKKN